MEYRGGRGLGRIDWRVEMNVVMAVMTQAASDKATKTLVVVLAE
jgi:hypothetical protein